MLDTMRRAPHYVEGFGDEVIFVLMICGVIMTSLCLVYFFTYFTKSGPLPLLSGPAPEIRAVGGPHSESCPICLEVVSFPVQTNCGHTFCGSCVLTCWDHGQWLMNPMPCPMCRQTITLIFLHFTEEEVGTVGRDQPLLVEKIGSYNRRFSGAPRPWMDYIYDIPTLIRQMWSDSGLDFLMRFRICAYFVLVVCYVITPMDILPESVFGVVGMIDDIVVVVIIALYVTNTYRTYVAYRNLELHIPPPTNLQS